MIKFDDRFMPWILSYRLKGVLSYLECDFITFDYISKEKVSLIPIPIQHFDSYGEMYCDEKLYIHPNFFLDSYHMLPHTLSEYDRLLLCQKSDRLTCAISEMYKGGGNAISVIHPLSEHAYVKLFIGYDNSYMINKVLHNKQKSLLCLKEIYNEIRKFPDLLEQFAYNPNQYQMAQLDANALKIIELNHPNLTLKQYHFAKYLAQADEFSSLSIASALGISSRTVNDYFLFLKDKLNTKDRISTILKCREYFENFWL
ncbi:MAG: hypothetical protein EP298_09570 [Gammaproteobacteria bacterium]|nr:MAG: hypothetical protein EP298_09570 [Gammaproteobacteria bacterium]UTW42275.1 hypothetical protein KFE69_12415 [bacterium SCSIO 12844]